MGINRVNSIVEHLKRSFKVLVKRSRQELVERKDDVIEFDLGVRTGRLEAGLLQLLGSSRHAGWGSRPAAGAGLALYQFLGLGLWLLSLLLRRRRAVAGSGRSVGRGSSSLVESGELAKRTSRVTQARSVAVVVAVAVRRGTAPQPWVTPTQESVVQNGWVVVIRLGHGQSWARIALAGGATGASRSGARPSSRPQGGGNSDSSCRGET